MEEQFRAPGKVILLTGLETYGALVLAHCCKRVIQLLIEIPQLSMQVCPVFFSEQLLHSFPRSRGISSCLALHRGLRCAGSPILQRTRFPGKCFTGSQAGVGAVSSGATPIRDARNREIRLFIKLDCFSRTNRRLRRTHLPRCQPFKHQIEMFSFSSRE